MAARPTALRLGIIYAVDEIKARVAQLKYAKRVFVLTDDQFELADADGMDGAVAEFKGCLDYAIKTEGFGFHALAVGAAPSDGCGWLLKATKIAAKGTGGSFDLCGPADAAVVAAEACGRLGAATRAGKMQIRLLGLAVDVKSTKLVKAAATPPLKKEAAESGGDVTRSTANAVPGQTDDVPDEDIVKGWMYGGEYLPTPDNASSGHGREAEDDAGEACRVLGFAAESSHDVMTSLGDALRVRAADGDARGAAFLAGLARALASAGAVAVCRWRNTARKKEEDLRLLVPDRDDPEALVAHRAPFTDDLRSVADLAPLDLAAPEFAAAARGMVARRTLPPAAVAALLATNHPGVAACQDLLVARAVGGAPDEAGLARRKKARYARLAPAPVDAGDAEFAWGAALKRTLESAAAAAAASTKKKERWAAAAPPDDGADAAPAADAPAAAAPVAIDKHDAAADFSRRMAAADAPRAALLRAKMRAVVLDFADASESSPDYLPKAIAALAALRERCGPGGETAAAFDAFLAGDLQDKRDELPDFDDALAAAAAATPFAAAAGAGDAPPPAAAAPPPAAAPMDVGGDSDDDDFA